MERNLHDEWGQSIVDDGSLNRAYCEVFLSMNELQEGYINWQAEVRHHVFTAALLIG
jgi:hypothetical protein